MDELTIAFKIESPPSWLPIGRTAENNWRTVEIDCSYWFNMNANGEVVLMYKPSCGMSPYPLLTERDGDSIIWRPKSGELVEGVGRLQAFFEVGTDVIGSSDMISCEVDSSLLGVDPGTDPGQTDLPWALDIIEQIAELSGHYPKIIDGVLYIWDSTLNDWVEFEASGGGAVDSVNGKTGVVVLDASDVGALPDDTQIPSKTSDLTNDSGFVTAQQAAASAPVQSVNGRTGAVSLGAADVHALPDSTVIPPTVTEQTVAGWGFTKNTGTYSKPSGGIPDSDIASAATWNAKGTYSKPSGGIPKSDLASAVQTSLGKADTALQTAPVTSVNNKTGAVTLGASDVHALPDSTVIPPTVTEQTVAGWGFTKNTGTYSKPASGIPASDLASGVIPVVPQMATQVNMSDWTSGKTVDAAVLKAGFMQASQELVYVTEELSYKADKTELPDASTSAPVMDGTAAVGTSTDYARADHVHPSDTTRLSTTGNAYRTASIPMGHLDATSTATVMTATVDGITELRDGVCMWLRNGVITSASGFTINVNGLGAKPCYSSLAAESRSTTIFNINYALLMIYNSTRVDGGCWDIVYGVDTNTTYTPVKLGFGYGTCTTAAATAAKTASISSYALTTGGIVSIKFDNDVPANATLNITSKGAKAIYHRGAAITAGVIKAGDTATFVYSTYYHLIAIDRDEAGDTLPAVTASDNGKFLRVVSGAWAAQAVPSAESNSFGGGS